MSSHGIHDRVAIVGMGCTPFGELWDKGLDDLIVDASTEAFSSAGVTKDDVDAYWLGTAQSGMSGITLARPLQLEGKPVSRVENYCTTGSEALRAAAYAVASGAYDMAMAVRRRKGEGQRLSGTERQQPTERRHRPDPHRRRHVLHGRPRLRPEVRRRSRPAERRVGHHLGQEPLQRGSQPRAQFRREVSKETICASPRVAGTLGVFDCAGVADGCAAAIVVRAEDACGTPTSPSTSRPSASRPASGSGLIDPGYDYTHFPECEAAAADAYAQAGITDPRRQLAFAEVHDCFTPTELVLMEDLGFAERGTAWKEVLAGTFALDGELPINPDGGLKSFGHPVGASGLRMFFECWLQLRGEATPSARSRPTAPWP